MKRRAGGGWSPRQSPSSELQGVGGSVTATGHLREVRVLSSYTWGTGIKSRKEENRRRRKH